MALASHTFLIVTILGLIGMMNGGEPVSELTFILIAFILPGTMLMSFYMTGDLNRVLNRTKSDNTHGGDKGNTDTDI